MKLLGYYLIPILCLYLEKSKFCFYIIIFSILASNAYAAQIKTFGYYKNFAISEVIGTAPNGADNLRIIISEYKPRAPMEIASLASPSYQPSTYILGKKIWEITENLPLTEIQCTVAYADVCDEETNKVYRGSCFKPCIGYGPKVLAFSEKTGLLYLVAQSVSIGTGGGLYFIFEADTKKMTVNFLRSKMGPFKGLLSPDGEYLALFDGGGIDIYDTTKHEFFTAIKWRHVKSDELGHTNDHIKWIDRKQFSYQDHARIKSSNYNRLTENIYNVSTRKIIFTRRMILPAESPIRP